MTAAHRHHNLRSSALVIASLLVIIIDINDALAQSQHLVLKHGAQTKHSGEYAGVVDLAIDPGFDHGEVAVTVDGQRVATGLTNPFHLIVDLGPNAIQHKISITATAPNGTKVRWTEMINVGLRPLGVKLRAIDAAAGIFEIDTTAPKGDPIEIVEIWDNGKVVASASEPPYRLAVPSSIVSGGFVQATARTRSGEEAADFWSADGEILVEEMQVRTVPIFVSVVDRNGVTHDDVDRSLFRIIDNGAEAEIIEFGKAFDRPISIALVLDSSASMTYSMGRAAKAAAEFVQHALKEGDRCSVTAVQDVPRRKHALSSDHQQAAKALQAIVPEGRTALFDSIASAIRELSDEKNRRAIVVLTDGSDTSSNWSYAEVEKLAREAAIPIYFIAYEGANEARDIDRLRHLASQTGGFVATATEQDLMTKYGEIEKDLRAQFAIKYQISDLGKSNQWRSVRVLVNSPKLTARTIRGYFTP